MLPDKTVKKCLFVYLFMVLVSGCQQFSGDSRPQKPIRLSPLDNSAYLNRVSVIATELQDLQAWQAPEQLAGLNYDGAIDSQEQRTLRYRDQDGRNQLTVSLYPLPGGWEAMPGQRAIAGQYGQIRQQRMDRAFKSQAQSVEFTHELSIDLDGMPSVQAQLEWQQQRQPHHNESILLVLDGNTFIRIINSSPQQSSRWLLQQSKRALAEFRAAQQPSAD